MANLINGLGGPDGFGTQSLPPNDDGSSAAIDITGVFPGGLNLFGTTYNQIYINNNGNITFQAPLDQFTPAGIGAGFTSPIIAPFWADVDTEGGRTTPTGGNATGSDTVWYNLDAPDHTVTITWDDVGYYSSETNKADAFQLQLIGEGGGNFEIKFIYQNISWVTGDASDGVNGLGGTPARAGYSAGNGVNQFELPQSGNQAQLLNLPQIIGNTGIAGIWEFDAENGAILSAPSGLTLAASTDSGALGDNLTNFSRPMITGNATAGDTITLSEGRVVLGTATAASDGTWRITTTALADGAHSLTATESDLNGNTSGASPALVVTIDTTPPPAPSGLALDPSTDTGAIGDSNTSIIQPLITGQGEAGDSVILDDGTTAVGTATVTSDGVWSVTTTVLTPGAHMLTATETDPAGNPSAVSAALALTIGSNAIGPTGPNQIFHFGANDQTVIGTSGADTIFGTSSGSTVSGLGGDDFLLVTGSGDIIAGGDGNDTIESIGASTSGVGAAGQHQPAFTTKGGFAAIGGVGDTLSGGAGDDTLALSGNNGLADGGSGNNTIFIAGTGNQIVGDGNTAIYLSCQNQTILDGPAGFHDTVFGFSQPAGDRIHLTTDTVANALANATTINNGLDTLLTLSDGSTIQLVFTRSIDSTFFS